jgi:hypothetical protein
MLRDLPFIDQSDVHNSESWEFPGVLRFYRVFVNGGELIVDLRNDKVVSVYISSSSQETIADVVDRLGPPEHILAEYYPTADAGDEYHIELFYPSNGAYYHVEDRPQTAERNGQDRIEADMRLSSVAFVVPGAVESMLTDLQAAERRIQCVLDNIQPWTGYGLIDVLPDAC